MKAAWKRFFFFFFFTLLEIFLRNHSRWQLSLWCVDPFVFQRNSIFLSLLSRQRHWRGLCWLVVGIHMIWRKPKESMPTAGCRTNSVNWKNSLRLGSRVSILHYSRLGLYHYVNNAFAVSGLFIHAIFKGEISKPWKLINLLILLLTIQSLWSKKWIFLLNWVIELEIH